VADPAVSVVMGVHRAPLQTLTEAVECMLSQSFSDFEFLIVDDGNEPAVLDYLAQVAARDGRVRVLHNGKNLGLTASLRIAIGAARGALIARQDADDLSAPGRLQAQYERFHANPGLVLAGTWFATMTDGVTSAPFTPRDDSAALRQELFHRNPFCHASTMFRRDAYERVGGYDLRFRTTQDMDLWMRLAHVGELGMVEQVLVTRRLHSESISHGSRAWRQVSNGLKIRWRERAAFRGGFAPGVILGATLYHAIITLIPMGWREHVSRVRWRVNRWLKA
jgi:glycosyltransferase involved in cell wall biosynthesis